MFDYHTAMERLGDALGFLWELLSQSAQSIIGGAFGALLTLAMAYWKQCRHRRSIERMEFEDVLDVSVTHFANGRMELLTQLEEPLADALPGEKNAVFVQWIRKAAKATSVSRIVLSVPGEEKPAPHLVYDALRNRIFGRFVNVLHYAASRQLGENFDKVPCVGALTCEPQFVTHRTDEGDPAWIEVLPEPEENSDTKRKVRLLLFTEAAITNLLHWCELEARLSPDQRTAAAILDELCGEQHVVLKKDAADARLAAMRKREGELVTTSGEGRIDALMASMGEPPRPVDRKRYVAMAQVARHIQAEDARAAAGPVAGKRRPPAYLRFDMPVPRPAKGRPHPNPNSCVLAGGFFPADPAEAEAHSVSRLSFERRPSRSPGKLYYKGTNGTVTGIVSRGEEILLIRKKLAGQEYLALPGGFLTSRDPRPELVRELCEEAVDARPGDATYRALLDRAAQAELVYTGPVNDPRNEPEAWIVDHVYHLDCAGLEFALRATEAVDPTEDVSAAQWQTVEFALGQRLFASHEAMIRAWAAKRQKPGAP